jgi:hypothetical protein
MKIWKYYNNCTKPAKEHGYDDEKRLQRELGHDERIKLRWNLLARQVEVWYVPSRSKPYCAYAIERPYNICRAIKHLKDADRARGTELEKYIKFEQDREKMTNEKIRGISEEVAKGAENYYKGKVSVTI